MADIDHGFLVLHKPKGITSRRLVDQINRLTNLKVGHTGTLDPLASGMMILCIGDATKFSQWVISSDKSYNALIQFGQQTATDDAEGDIVAEVPTSSKIITEADLIAILPKFTGSIIQKPPAYSAIHINGQRAYKLARDNKDFEIPERTVYINNIVIQSFDQDNQTAELSIHCQSGTYIRSIARDLGHALNNYAYLADLKRTWVAPFSHKDLTEVDAIPPVISLDSFFSKHSNLPKADLSHEEAIKLAQGKTLILQEQNAQTSLAVFYQAHFLGIIEPIKEQPQQFKSTKLRSNILEYIHSISP